MKDFILLFRQAGNEQPLLNDEEIAKINKKWFDWIGDIEAQGKLSDHGSRLEKAGKVLKPGGVITDGPFVEIRESLGGFIVISAENLEEATTLAHGCPILESNGSVEIRALLV
ncbi:YciI family protein [Sphingobacterium sp. ML3W]|uniref:YciI family protein n=1 Tax=Sphingobacterium TaxID=28453 RepID=UPI000FC023FB|nr:MULTISPECIES: YciI family protein [unclassified Sphingobacterium]WFA77337.1 YciI family protein [Sphingobacterium sp. ML3W]